MSPVAAPAALPKGAQVGPEGHLTILDAPPAPYEPTLPGAPQPPTAAQIAEGERFRRVAAFQNAVHAEAMALRDRLERTERGNFVDVGFDNEGTPTVVYSFLRDGPGTLARYTRDPRFRGETVRYSNGELRRVADDLFARFRDDRVIGGVGTGNAANRVQVDLLVTEAEFRALAARKGYRIPESVELSSSATQPANEINRPLRPELARFFRLFPRSDRPVGIVHAIASRAKIVLKDGCLRAPDHRDALVLLPLGAQVFIDRDGYLAWGEGERPGYARVGESVEFPGSVGAVTAPDLVAPIHRACGPGRVIAVTGLASAAAEGMQRAATDNARTFQTLREMYGLSEAQARRALERCKARAGGDFCPMSPPPPPAAQAACPTGTTSRGGLCRTPQGYVRPIPTWIEELAR